MESKRAEWIFYPGDFEIWLRREVEFRRDERRITIPPIWRVDSPYTAVRFRRTVHLEAAESVVFRANGEFMLQIDGVTMNSPGQGVVIQAGEHSIFVQVHHFTRVPSLFVEGPTVKSDHTWEVSHLWQSGYVKAGRAGFHQQEIPPSDFRLDTIEIEPVNAVSNEGALLIDFGKETFGYVQLHDIRGQGKVRLVYGESLEEANDFEHCETYDIVDVTSLTTSLTLSRSRALRYVRITSDEGVSIGSVTLLYEYLPLTYRGQFKSSNEKLNQIWEVSSYTFHLNTREFFLDGIKRDRWVWSGDAYQSYLMNYYLFFDLPVTQRTMIALRGKDPIEHHLNTIMDYTLYWFMGLEDYYQFTGDLSFIRDQYDSMLRLIKFCESRSNEDGMLEGQNGDWVFVDWADMDKEGALAFEQMLYCLSLESIVRFAELLGDEASGDYYRPQAEQLRKKIRQLFWDEEKGAYIHRIINGSLDAFVTKHPNMMAVLYGFADAKQMNRVKEQVLLNPSVPKITTPYMRFYELAALCEVGEQSFVLHEMLDYWGGMLDLGATSFWEEYDPAIPMPDQYAMYGRKYGKSLCHAWGASPIYLIGRYYLGVTPARPGYEEVFIRPALGGLEWMEGRVPVPAGEVYVFMNRKSIRCSIPAGKGRLQFRSRHEPNAGQNIITMLADDWYELCIDVPGITYEVVFTPMD
ncbi:hypothetical protein B1748_07895 [Paenibacillus sp. MY03]|uniref:alpha-L-rhamnosidase-related protein n=1 Tax=Paenibacillus sp. MY03 TaxID=302980 RepID=UPI000B3C1222|nr:family 78 glycoside hydrolase catalytic domain [Paenibacillus sp. MY03]OUS77070.1 hypothetical protein B1748_07895 [Paenibacillus sp. MY03]